MPTIDTIEKICNVLDISVSDFFVFASKPQKEGYLTADEMVLLEMYRPLSGATRDRIRAYIEGIYDTEIGNKE